jgi:hypothetical protein
VSTSERFDRFVARLSLTAAERAEAQARTASVAGKLHERYYPNTAYNGSTKLLIGSHGKRTRVRPPRDVDMIFIMPPAQFTRYDAYAGNGQSQMLQDVRRVLAERYPNTTISGNGRVVDVKFTAGHSVQVVPAFRGTSKFIIGDSHDGGKWEISDYAAEAKNIDDSDKLSVGNTRTLIKIMKVWQQEQSVPIKSLTIELRAVNFLAGWKHANKSSEYHDWMVRDYFAELIRKANSWCISPGIEEKCHYGDAWLAKARRAYGHALEACNHESNKHEYLATAEWQAIFGSVYGGP